MKPRTPLNITGIRDVRAPWKTFAIGFAEGCCFVVFLFILGVVFLV